MEPQGSGEASVFVGGIPWEMTEEELQALFAPRYASLASVKVIPDGNSNPPRHKGYGFARFHNPADAAAAISEMNGFPVGSMKLRVSASEGGKGRGGGGFGRGGMPASGGGGAGMAYAGGSYGGMPMDQSYLQAGYGAAVTPGYPGAMGGYGSYGYAAPQPPSLPAAYGSFGGQGMVGYPQAQAQYGYGGMYGYQAGMCKGMLELVG